MLDTPTTLPRVGDATDGALGRRLSRVDGPLKVQGRARYALESSPAGLLHAVIVQSTIAAGEIVAIDVAEAEAAPGVVRVFTPDNTPMLNAAADWLGQAPERRTFAPLTREIRFNGQQVAAVVAETLEEATEAACRLAIRYEEAPAVTLMEAAPAGAGLPLEPLAAAWGDAEAALAAAPVTLEGTYATPREYAVPIEPHGLIAQWEGDRLTLHEPSQWLAFMGRTYAEWFGIPFENVRIVSPFIGGGFGSKGFAYGFGALAAIAARELGRPVKLAVTRPQSFTALGGRPATRQTLRLGATAEGRLLSIVQTGANETSVDAAWAEPLGAVTKLMYAVPNLRSRQELIPVNTVVPGALRAPGENPSAFALESAIDELAYKVGLDPLAIRLLNYAEEDPKERIPWSSRRLREAFEVGAKAFGWAGRCQAPRSMRRGRSLIGWGLSAGTYPVRRTPGEALVRITAEGRVEVLTSAIDMGQGTYTILAQAAAEAVGVAEDAVTVILGDSLLPGAPVGGGSQLANLMTSAVYKAALAARSELVGLAINDEASPFRTLQANTLSIIDGRIGPARSDGLNIPLAELMRRLGCSAVEARRDTFPKGTPSDEERRRTYSTITGSIPFTEGGVSRHSWCAHFVEVEVDEDFGTVRVSRVVSALDSGRLYNPKLAESQWKGGIIMGIGQALLEEGRVDPRNGRVVNANLGDYLIPTHADIPAIEVISVGVPDYEASAMGGKAVGELSIVGTAAAIANAVFHATGKRIRDLPITFDKLIA